MVVNEIISTAVVSNVAGATGSGAAISANYATGMANLSRAYPVKGRVKGTSMVLKQMKKLQKKSKKLNKNAL